MQICALLTSIECKVSITQVTVKACGPIVLLNDLTLYKLKLGRYRPTLALSKKITSSQTD